MISFYHKAYKITYCTDLKEWGKEFYGLEGNEMISEEHTDFYMGFAILDDNEIFLYEPKTKDDQELQLLIAHEIGHLVELEYPKNPETNDYEVHEAKANHYEAFYKLVQEIFKKIRQ